MIMAESSGRAKEEREEEASSSEEEEDEQATILYDVVSYREWEQEPEVVKKKQSDVLPGKSRGGWLQLAPPPSLLPPTVEAIQVQVLSRSKWFIISRMSGSCNTLAF